MESLIKQQTSNNIVTQKALWLLIAIAINALELAIPRLPFLPWLKPGFANVITILWIIKFGFKDALLYTALRIWISGFYFGFSLFTFLLSLGGGFLSTMIMSLLWITLGKRRFAGTVGIAVVGALFHNIGQLGVVYFMMAQNIRLFAQVPFMLGAAVVFGSITGLLVPYVAKIFGDDQYSLNPAVSLSFVDHRQNIILSHKIIVTLTFLVSISLVFIADFWILSISAVVFSLIGWTLNPKKPSVLIYPMKFYILFLFIGCMHLFFSYGTRIETLPFITYEGLSAFVRQSLRLWCWLQAAHIFKRFHFHELFFGMLHRLFPDKSSTLEAGMIALRHFPQIVKNVKLKEKTSITKLLFNPRTTVAIFVGEMKQVIADIIVTGYDKTEALSAESYTA